MKILILAGSPRKGGNTDMLVEAFERGARERHEVETVHVYDYKVGACMACDACAVGGKCCQNDDMDKIYKKLAEADMLVVASPVYYYGVSAQLKAVVDRLHNPIRNTFKITKMALLLVGAATLPDLFDSIEAQYRLVLRYFDLEDKGRVLVRGAREKGTVADTDGLERAYRLGREV